MTETKSYAQVFTNIKPKAVEVTKELIKSGVWKKDIEKQDKAIMMGKWVQQMATIYNMETPKFYFVNDKAEYQATGGGCYMPSSNEIYLFYKPSVTTLLHEFRHAMQFQKGVKQYHNNVEEDARAWSVSLFYQTAPKAYQRAKERGTLKFD